MHSFKAYVHTHTPSNVDGGLKAIHNSTQDIVTRKRDWVTAWIVLLVVDSLHRLQAKHVVWYTCSKARHPFSKPITEAPQIPHSPEGGEREKEREREREGERDRETARERDRERDRETKTESNLRGKCTNHFPWCYPITNREKLQLSWPNTVIQEPIVTVTQLPRPPVDCQPCAKRLLDTEATQPTSLLDLSATDTIHMYHRIRRIF